jgi:hypothetical protein
LVPSCGVMAGVLAAMKGFRTDQGKELPRKHP